MTTSNTMLTTAQPSQSGTGWVVPVDPDVAANLKFCLINKNFCHYPLARHPAATPAWLNTRSGKWRGCVLHWHPESIEAIVILKLPSSALPQCPGLERAPNRYDMDVLLRLSAMALVAQHGIRHQLAKQAGKKALEGPEDQFFFKSEIGSMAYADAFEKIDGVGDITLKFNSLRALVRALGRAPDAQSNRASVTSSLQLWRRLRVRHRRWHEPSRKVDKRFRPFIEKLQMPRSGRGPVLVKLSAEYMTTLTTYALKVPFPLPLASEPALNLGLFLPLFLRRPKKPKTCPSYELQHVCEKLGIVGNQPWILYGRLGSALKLYNGHLKATKSPSRYHATPRRGSKVRFVKTSRP